MPFSIRDLFTNKQFIRRMAVIIGVFVLGIILAVVIGSVVSAAGGWLFLLIYYVILAIVLVMLARYNQRRALRLNGQGVHVKRRIMQHLIVNGDAGDRQMDFSASDVRRSVFASGLHRDQHGQPHYHCTLVTYDESDLKKRGIVHVTSQLYFVRTDMSPIMKTMRVENIDARTGRKRGLQPANGGEQVDHYDMPADDEELTELLRALQAMPSA